MTRSAVRRWTPPVAYWIVLAVVAGLLLGHVDAGQDSRFRLSGTGDRFQVPTVVLPTLGAVVVLLLGAAALAAVATGYAVRDRRRGTSLLLGFVGLLVTAYIVWEGAGADISLVVLLGGTVLLAVPLVFGALGGVLCERAGVINIAIEGQLLAGAFASATTASLTGSIAAGLVAAALAGLLVSTLLAVFAIRYLVDQVVLGVVLNVLVTGLTGFLYSQVLAQDQERWNSPPRLSPLPVPVLSDIPLLGPVLFNQTIIVYVMYVLVAAVTFALFRTRWGLRVRAVGEHPQAADTAGIAVNPLRLRAVLYGGLIAGFGGAFFTLGRVGAFSDQMTAGQGFIALAAVIFGRWTPVGALFAALLFGFASNLQSTLAIIGTSIPSQFLLMAPYLVTIFAVAGLVGRVRAPAADGIPYRP